MRTPGVRWHVYAQRFVRLLTQNLAVHHHLPRVYRQIRVVETPIEYLGSYWFVCWVVVRCEILVCECVGRVDTCSWIEYEHLLEEVKGWRGKWGGVGQRGVSTCAGSIIWERKANSPRGSALANFWLNGTLARFGKLWTNRRVCW